MGFWKRRSDYLSYNGSIQNIDLFGLFETNEICQNGWFWPSGLAKIFQGLSQYHSNISIWDLEQQFMGNELVSNMLLYFAWWFNFLQPLIYENMSFDCSDIIALHPELISIYIHKCKTHIPTSRFEFGVLIAVY